VASLDGREPTLAACHEFYCYNYLLCLYLLWQNKFLSLSQLHAYILMLLKKLTYLLLCNTWWWWWWSKFLWCILGYIGLYVVFLPTF